MTAALQTILYRDPADQRFELWACRGEGRGCARNRYRTAKKPCEDCFGPLPEDWTLQKVVDHLKRGDA